MRLRDESEVARATRATTLSAKFVDDAQKKHSPRSKTKMSLQQHLTLTTVPRQMCLQENQCYSIWVVPFRGEALKNMQMKLVVTDKGAGERKDSPYQCCQRQKMPSISRCRKMDATLDVHMTDGFATLFDIKNEKCRSVHKQ